MRCRTVPWWRWRKTAGWSILYDRRVSWRCRTCVSCLQLNHHIRWKDNARRKDKGCSSRNAQAELPAFERELLFVVRQLQSVSPATSVGCTWCYGEKDISLLLQIKNYRNTICEMRGIMQDCRGSLGKTPNNLRVGWTSAWTTPPARRHPAKNMFQKRICPSMIPVDCAGQNSDGFQLTSLTEESDHDS